MATDPSIAAFSLGEGGFEPYLRAVRKHPVVLVLVTLASVLGAGGWLATRPVTYRATADVLVTPAQVGDTTYQGLSVLTDTPDTPVQVFETAAALIDSPAAATLAARHLGPGSTAGEVSGAVTVEPVGQSNVLAVQATEPTARRAVQIADSFTQAALQVYEHTIQRQAAKRLAASDASSSEQLTALQAVRSGIDPMFAVLHYAPPGGTRVGDSAARLLSLALIPGVVFGMAASLLAEALVDRRRRRGVATLPEPPS